MSWWDEFTSPINHALNSNVFKAVFPVQALAQGLTQGATKLAHIGGPQGLNAANQYAVGAGVGGVLGGGSALMHGASQAPAASSSPMSAVNLLSSMRDNQPQQQAPHEDTQQLLQRIYMMFPHLRPSSGPVGQGGYRGF